MANDVCHPATAHLPEPRTPYVDPTADLGVDEPIEIVESIVLEGPIEVVPIPLESGFFRSEAEAAEAAETDETGEEDMSRAARIERELIEAAILSELVEPELPASEPPAAPSFADEAGGPDPDLRPAPIVSTPPPPLKDPYDAFLQTLSDVACDAGHTYAASEIGEALANDAIACAWRAILNGESDDFSLCGTPLDEWAAAALAKFLSVPHKAQQLRRELRVRGVAAFGLVEVAA